MCTSGVKLSVVHEAVSQLSYIWDCLRAGRQALLATSEEAVRSGDTKPAYRPGCRGPARSNRAKPVGRACAGVRLMAVAHQKEAQPPCWKGERAAALSSGQA